MAIDFRAGENRLEGFLKYYSAILTTEEYDPAYYTLNYLFKRYELNSEQRLWVCWLYGFIYNVATAWVVWNEFPDLMNVDMQRLTDWENRNWDRMDYETDTRYKKGKIQQALPAYLNAVREAGSQAVYFNRICNTDNPRTNFDNLWKTVMTWPLFGRYSVFFYTETLMRCGGLNIQCSSLFLDDIDGSKSHRNGLCYTLQMDHWDLHKSNPDFKGYSYDMIETLKAAADRVLDLARHRFPAQAHQFDYFNAETAWCAYKGFFRGRRYFGFYLDRDAEQIRKAESRGWSGVDWSVFWQCRRECLNPSMLCENHGYYAPKKDLQTWFQKTGEMVYLDRVFPEVTNTYKPPRAVSSANLFAEV